MKYEKIYLCSIATYDEDWEVYMSSRQDMAEVNGSTYDGITANATHEITIANDLDIFREKETVYHEVCHAFNNSLYNRKEEFTHEEMCDFVGRYGKNIHEQAQKILKAIENKGVAK